jgi:hypothetical protein
MKGVEKELGPAVEAIKVLARGHQNLIWTRTRHTNALRSALREYYPAALEAFDSLTADDALALLAHQRRTNFAPGTRHVLAVRDSRRLAAFSLDASASFVR